MDDGKGRFKPFDSQIQAMMASEALGRMKENSGVFEVGEEIDLRGSTFIVQRITKRELVLTLKRRKVEGGGGA